MLTNLNHEGVEIPQIVEHPDASHIPEHLIQTPGDHATHKRPRPPPKANIDMDEKGGEEDGQKSDVGAQSRPVAIDAPLGRALLERTVGMWPEEVECWLVCCRQVRIECIYTIHCPMSAR